MTVVPNYRMHVIARLPRLKMLDNKEVKESERENARRVVRQEEEQMAGLFSNYLLERKLEVVIHRIVLHSELLTVVHGRVSALNSAELPSCGQLDTRRYLEVCTRGYVCPLVSAFPLRYHVSACLRVLLELQAQYVFQRFGRALGAFVCWQALHVSIVILSVS